MVKLSVLRAHDLKKIAITLRSLTFVEIKVGEICRTTLSTKESSGYAVWDSKHTLCVLIPLDINPKIPPDRLDSSSLDESSKITFSVFHNATVPPNKLRGKAEIQIRELLDLQRQQPDEGEHLPSVRMLLNK